MGELASEIDYFMGLFFLNSALYVVVVNQNKLLRAGHGLNDVYDIFF